MATQASKTRERDLGCALAEADARLATAAAAAHVANERAAEAEAGMRKAATDAAHVGGGDGDGGVVLCDAVLSSFTTHVCRL